MQEYWSCMQTMLAPAKLKTFYVASYMETDAHGRDYGQQKFCLCTSAGWINRGIRLDRWFRVLAINAADAKARVLNGEAHKCS